VIGSVAFAARPNFEIDQHQGAELHERFQVLLATIEIGRAAHGCGVFNYAPLTSSRNYNSATLVSRYHRGAKVPSGQR
jgi:hypothetical protein